MSDPQRKLRKPRTAKIYTTKTINHKNHSFNLGIATDYCPNMAIWLGHLAHWTENNLANNNNIHDGLAWSYDTLEALLDQFPYYSKRQIETIINNSVAEGLVTKGNYNQTGYDRTCWYALTPKSYFYFAHLLKTKYINRLVSSISTISQKCEMENTDLGNGSHRNVTPIPDTIPDTDPDKKLTNCKPISSSSFTFSNTIDKSILDQKLDRDERTNEEFMIQVKEHVDNHSDKKFPFMQRAQAVLKLLTKMKSQNVIFYVAGKSPTEKTESVQKKETPQERDARYKKEREANPYLKR